MILGVHEQSKTISRVTGPHLSKHNLPFASIIIKPLKAVGEFWIPFVRLEFPTNQTIHCN